MTEYKAVDPFRQETRRRLNRNGQASVELEDPTGRRLAFDLLNISNRGLCFGVDLGEWVPARGDTFKNVVLRVMGDAFIGTLEIVHATEGFLSGSVCGAKFHPRTQVEGDQLSEAIRQFPVCDGQ